MATLQSSTPGQSVSLNPLQFYAWNNGLSASDDDMVVCGVYVDVGDTNKNIADKRPILKLGELKRLSEKLRKFAVTGGLSSLRFQDATLRVDLSDMSGGWKVEKAASDNGQASSLTMTLTYHIERPGSGMVHMDERSAKITVSREALVEFAGTLERETATIAPPPERPWSDLPV